MKWLRIRILIRVLKFVTDLKFNIIVKLLEEAWKKEEKFMATIEELEAQIRESVAVEQSAVLLIQGFAARLEAAGVDPEKLAQLKADLDASEQNLAAAVAANTPAVP